MIEMLKSLWDMLLQTGSFVAAFATFVVIVAVYAGPFLALVGFGLLVREWRNQRLGTGPVDGMLLADSYHYAPTHSWVRAVLGGDVKVGLDDLARRILAGAERVVLPPAGRHVKEGEPALTVTCNGREVELPSPVTGTVIATNEEVASQPDVMDRLPYTKGWLFAVRPDSDSFLRLPTGEAARSWFRAEERRFGHFLERQFGLAAADGGKFLVPPQELLPEAKWRELVASFLTH